MREKDRHHLVLVLGTEEFERKLDLGHTLKTPEQVLGYVTTTKHSQASPEPPGLAQLSARERQLVTLVAQGLTDTQIAAQLYISVRTVRSHLDRIRDKSGCRRRADLTRLALKAGLVESSATGQLPHRRPGRYADLSVTYTTSVDVNPARDHWTVSCDGDADGRRVAACYWVSARPAASAASHCSGAMVGRIPRGGLGSGPARDVPQVGAAVLVAGGQGDPARRERNGVNIGILPRIGQGAGEGAGGDIPQIGVAVRVALAVSDARGGEPRIVLPY
jgi:DNA-binding CsgD family transcriptional regulator